MKTSLLASALFCTVFALSGCQSMTGATTPTTTSPTDNDWSAAMPMPRLLQAMTKYQWTLTHVSNNNGKLVPFQHQPPLMMDVRPDTLLFQEGCHRYQGTFHAWRPLPYPYSLPEMSNMPDKCQTASRSDNSHSNKEDIQQALEIAFAPLSDTYFRLDPIPVSPNAAPMSTPVTKQVALTTDKGKVFVFSGAAKPTQKPSGLPISNALLERYDWQLIRATDDTHAPITELSDPNVPITANFRIDSNHQGVGFLTGCNGVGGDYALSTNQTLLIGQSASTLMGCGDIVNGIEDYLARLMHHSTSHLTLIQADNAASFDTKNRAVPSYALMQQFATGETLVWQNVPKKVFNPPADNNDTK